ncbi:hypothetical protein OIV83_004314 [Microbotryomycetes sp. JL201]|nr:hypothetical protein OIV83_004312 [Microbotryomycetes sp. JL201]KAK4049168.1 hypothetical protein OIV83_004314 [Microbotryomycetes sp. JL201]
MAQALASMVTLRYSGFLNMAPDNLGFLGEDDDVLMTKYTAATTGQPALSSDDDSGWRVSVELDKEGRTETGPTACWRSGETLCGVVRMQHADPATPGARRKRIASVIARAFWQSSTMYRVAKIVPEEPKAGLSKVFKSANAFKTVAELRGEWHRSEFGEGAELWHGGELEDISREVEGDFPLLAAQSRSQAADSEPSPPAWHENRDLYDLPFRITLPTVSRVTSCNALPNGGPLRRQLQHFKRTPPSSLKGTDVQAGAIEWIVEVIVRYMNESGAQVTPAEAASATSLSNPDGAQDGDLPSFPEAVNEGSDGFDEFGLLQPSDSLAVIRTVFPFEPLDHHVQDLYSAWRPKTDVPWAEPVARYNGLTLEEIEDPRPVSEGIVPSFGRDPRDEALGGSHMGPKRKTLSTLLEVEGGREKWIGYEKRMSVKGRFGRFVAWIRSEMHIPKPATINRHDSHLTVLCHFSLKTTASTASGPPRTLSVEKVVVVLTRRILTRGGRDDRPKYGLEEVRREELKLWEPQQDALTRMRTLLPAVSRASLREGEVEEGRAHLKLVSGEPGVDLRLEIPLQGDDLTTKGRRNVPTRELHLSTRAPNIELEYVMSITVHPIGQPSFYAARVPVQLLAGDLVPPPHFDVPEQPPAY